MRFGLSDDQALLQDSVRRTLERDGELATVRRFAEGDTAPAQTIHDALVELGLPLVLVPEAQGGLGLGVLEAALIQEMLGRYVAPSSFAPSYGMAVAALSRVGANEWLSQIASGEVIMGVATNEMIDSRENAAAQIKDNTITGQVRFVLGAELATHYLIATPQGLGIVARQDVKETALTTIDKTRHIVALDLNTPCAVLEDTSDATQHMINIGRVLLAADTLGAANMMLEKAVDYAKEREQFNRPIGSFQAVKHLCAEMAAQLEPCRALVWYAAYAQSNAEKEEAALMSRLAVSHLAEVGKFVARTATEVHGGMGFTDLLGLHYWFKRIGFNRQILGSPEIVRAEAANAQWKI